MLRTAPTQTKIASKDYQIIVAHVLKILQKNKEEQKLNLDFSAPATKGDIIESRNELTKIITKNRNDLEKIITKNRNDLEKTITDNRNETNLKLKDIEKEIVEIKSNLELKISESRVHIIKWVVATNLTGMGILLVIIFGLVQFLKVAT